MTEPVSLTGLPQALANALGTSLFVGQILASITFLALFLVPILYLTKGKNIILSLSVAGLVVGFETAIGWLNVWFMILFILIVSLMFASSFRDFVTGRSH
jgi:hypothetical protein